MSCILSGEGEPLEATIPGHNHRLGLIYFNHSHTNSLQFCLIQFQFFISIPIIFGFLHPLQLHIHLQQQKSTVYIYLTDLRWEYLVLVYSGKFFIKHLYDHGLVLTHCYCTHYCVFGYNTNTSKYFLNIYCGKFS